MICRRIACCTLSILVVGAIPAVAHAQRTVFVNLDPQAIVADAGNDPAANSFSTGNFNGGMIDGWVALDDEQRAELLYYFKEATVPFDIHYTFERPAAGTYDMLVFGTEADTSELFTDIACSTAVGLADCEDADAEDIAFMFWECLADAQQSDMKRVAFHGLTALGFGWGLENLTSSGQIMASFSQSGLEFGDECTPISGASMCTHQGCKAGQQNSTADLTPRVGLRVDDGPPTVEITAPPDLSVVASDLTVSATVNDQFGGMTVTLDIVEVMQSLVDDTPPYEWDLNDIPDGTWTLQVTAVDADMNMTMQQVVVCVGLTDCDGVDGGTSSSGSGEGSSTGVVDTSSTGGDESTSGSSSSEGEGGGTGIGPVSTSVTSGFGNSDAGTGCGCTSDRAGDRSAGGWWLALSLLLVRRSTHRRRRCCPHRDRTCR